MTNVINGVNFNSHLLIDVDKKIKEHSSNFQFYNIESITIIGGSVVASISGVIACAALAPVYLPLCLIGIGSLMPVIKEHLYNPPKSRSNMASYRLEVYKGIKSQLEKMHNWDKNQVENRLLDMNIFSARYRGLGILKKEKGLDFSLEALKPVLAQYAYWKIRAKKGSILAKKHLKAAELQRKKLKSGKKKASKTKTKILRERLLAYKVQEEDVLPSKIKAAYMLYVLTHIHTQKEIADFGVIDPIPFQERALLIQHENRNPYFKFKHSKKEMSRSWILDARIETISKRIFRKHRKSA